MIDTDEVLARLKGLGLLDTYHVTTFKAIHRKKSGGVQAATVEIYDAGWTHDSATRYRCIARTDDGKVTAGNDAGSIITALSLVHRYELDWTAFERPPGVLGALPWISNLAVSASASAP
jgi:hypothetical protein